MIKKLQMRSQFDPLIADLCRRAAGRNATEQDADDFALLLRAFGHWALVYLSGFMRADISTEELVTLFGKLLRDFSPEPRSRAILEQEFKQLHFGSPQVAG